MTSIPTAIIENIRQKEAVIFIGAGFSIAAGFPAGMAIATLLARKLQSDGRRVAAIELKDVAEQFDLTYGRPRLVAQVESFLRTPPQDEISASHRLLASLVKHGFVSTIVTTNYDTLIEDACDRLGVPLNVVTDESQLSAAAGSEAVLYKIHGDFAHPEILVFTPLDYQQWNKKCPRIVSQLQAIFDKNALLFLGYSLLDFNVLSLLLGPNFASSATRGHKRFAALYASEQFDDATNRIRQYNVEAFHCNDTEDLLRSVLLRLPLTLTVKHLVFNYPSWYPDQQAQYGGIETFIDYLKKHPAESGTFRHLVETVYSSQMLQSSPRQMAYTSSPTYPASFYFFRAAAKAAVEEILSKRRLGQESPPDIIHMHFLALSQIANETGIPTVCTSHSLLSTDLGYTKGLFDGAASPGAKHEVRAVFEAERRSAAAAPFVTVVSKAHEEEVRAIGARSIRQLPPPFDPNEFRPEDDRVSARLRAGLENRFTVTYVGRPDRRKGLETLIRACEKVAEVEHNLQLVLVGYGFFHEGGKLIFGSRRFSFDTSLLEQRGARLQVKSAYNASTVGVYYASSDVVVVPSIYEPMGYVVLEAMACGRAVVASRVGGIVEHIEDNRNGLLFQPGNPDELADKILALHRDQEWRGQLARQAREDSLHRRPIKEIVNDWHQLYRQAAFAFGESLYPDTTLMEAIRALCEGLSVNQYSVQLNPETTVSLTHGSTLDPYGAAMLGCTIAQVIQAAHGHKCRLPAGIPVDGALLRAIALELQRALRRKSVVVPFSVPVLADLMMDLALAMLNTDPPSNEPIELRAHQTLERMNQPWLQRTLFPDER